MMKVFPFLTLVLVFPSETQIVTVMLYSIRTGSSVSQCKPVYVCMCGVSFRLCEYVVKNTSEEKKRMASALTHTHTHAEIYKYSSTIFVKAGDKHRVFPHRLWLPFLSTEWKTERKSQKRVREGENYRSLCHCLLMS